MHPLECNLNQQTNSIATNLNYQSTSQNTLKSNSFFKTKVKITTSLASCLKYWSKFFLPLRMRCFSSSSSSSSSFFLIYLFIYLFIYLLYLIYLSDLSIYLATKQIISNIFLKGLGQNKPRVEESRLSRKCVGAEPRERRENKINTFAQGGVNVRKNSPVTLWIFGTSRGEWRAKDIAGVKGVAYS